MDPSLAYHFHFTNVGRDRSRAEKIPTDETNDNRVAETVRAQMATERGRTLTARVAAVKRWRVEHPEQQRVKQARDFSAHEGTACPNCA